MQRKRNRARRAGYTLVELMIVVIIILITASLAGPAFMSAYALNRASYGAQDLLRLSRHARSASTSSGKAVLLVLGGVDGHDRAELWARDNDDPDRHRCPSPTPNLLGAADPDGWRKLDSVNASDYEVGTSRIQFDRFGFSGAVHAVCFRPGGDMLVSLGGAFSEPPDLQVVRVRNFVNGVEKTPAREVVYPFIASPRMRLDALGSN